jgi:ElaB/YqjD/DUF883 family membrane-anchored ribosome-binding protein
MMKHNIFGKKVNQDVDKAKKDLATLGDDSVTGLSRIFKQLVDDAKETVSVAVKTFNKTAGQRLSQYNAKAQDVADRVPGGFGKKAAGYPWVTITMSLAFGLLLGVLLKPGRQPVG